MRSACAAVAASVALLVVGMASCSKNSAQSPAQSQDQTLDAALEAAAAARANVPMSAEMSQLKFLLGTWKRDMKQIELKGKTVTVSSTESWKTMPGGQYIRHTAEWKNSEGKSGGQMSMVCYDPELKKYRIFQFDSDGRAIEMIGEMQGPRLTLDLKPLVGFKDMPQTRMTMVKVSDDALTGRLELIRPDDKPLTISEWTDARVK